jgi:hypothetical protein
MHAPEKMLSAFIRSVRTKDIMNANPSNYDQKSDFGWDRHLNR